MKHSTPFESGWTLIEIVVILIVAAIVLPALIIPFTEGVRDLNIPVIADTLALLAQEEMEEKVVCFNYQSVAGWSSIPLPAPFADYSSEGVVDPNVTFGPVQTGIKQVTVTVTHSSGQTLSLVTVKTNWERKAP